MASESLLKWLYVDDKTSNGYKGSQILELAKNVSIGFIMLVELTSKDVHYKQSKLMH